MIHNLDEKIIAVCKVEDIEREIEDAEDLKMCVMDAIKANSLGTTSTTLLSSNESSKLEQGNNAFSIPPSSPGSYPASPQQLQGNSGAGTEPPKAVEQNCLN